MLLDSVSRKRATPIDAETRQCGVSVFDKKHTNETFLRGNELAVFEIGCLRAVVVYDRMYKPIVYNGAFQGL